MPLPLPPTLITLDLAGNGLTGDVPPALPPTMAELLLHNNHLTGAVPEQYAKVPPLETLSLANNSLAGRLPAGLAYCRRLRTLDVSGNAGVDGPLFQDWSRAGELRALLLRGCSLGGDLPASLLALPSLAALDVAGNAFSASLPDLAASLPEDGTSLLRYLDLSGNPGVVGRLRDAGGLAGLGALRARAPRSALFGDAVARQEAEAAAWRVPRVLALDGTSVAGEFPTWLVAALAALPAGTHVTLPGLTLACPVAGFPLAMPPNHHTLDGLTCVSSSGPVHATAAVADLVRLPSVADAAAAATAVAAARVKAMCASFAAVVVLAALVAGAGLALVLCLQRRARPRLARLSSGPCCLEAGVLAELRVEAGGKFTAPAKATTAAPRRRGDGGGAAAPVPPRAGGVGGGVLDMT